MKFRMIALAALTAAAGSSQAITLADIDTYRGAGTLKEVSLFGASAQSTMVAAYMKNVVCAGATDYNEYWNDAAGKNFRAYSCTLATAHGYGVGAHVLLTKRDAGGSIYGVNHVADALAAQQMTVSSATCTTAGVPVGVTALCGAAGNAPAVPDAGLSDVEPAQFALKVKINGISTTLNQPTGTDDNGNIWAVPATANMNSLDIASFGQTIFGIAVTKDLRNALQSAQGLTVGSDLAADMPNMGKAFVSGVLSGFVRGGVAGFPSWQTVTGNAADASKNVKVCRRTDGSGTQVVSNQYFLHAGELVDTVKGMLAPIKSGVAANTDGTPFAGLVVNEGSGTGDVETCLNTTNGTFALGVLTREKDPLINGKNYRFVKLDGAAPVQALARVGQYGMVYTSSMQFKKTNTDVPKLNFLKLFRTNAVSSNKIALYAGLEAKNGLMAGPSQWQVPAALCATGTDPDDALYGSCVERVDFSDKLFNTAIRIYGLATTKAYKTNSGAPLHLVK